MLGDKKKYQSHLRGEIKYDCKFDSIILALLLNDVMCISFCTYRIPVHSLQNTDKGGLRNPNYLIRFTTILDSY